jgi:hypothetical protein
MMVIVNIGIGRLAVEKRIFRFLIDVQEIAGIVDVMPPAAKANVVHRHRRASR